MSELFCASPGLLCARLNAAWELSAHLIPPTVSLCACSPNAISCSVLGTLFHCWPHLLFRYDNVLAWATDKEAAVAAGSSDPSASLFKTRSNAAGADSRPLYATLEVLLDLMFRQLLFDPSMPSADFSLEACLKLIKKQDKDMGN